MVAVLDADARREAQILIDQYGDLALACAEERAQEAAARGNAVLVGLWEIVAFNIRSMSPMLQAVEYREGARRRRGVAAKPGSTENQGAIPRPSSTYLASRRAMAAGSSRY